MCRLTDTSEIIPEDKQMSELELKILDIMQMSKKLRTFEIAQRFIACSSSNFCGTSAEQAGNLFRYLGC